MYTITVSSLADSGTGTLREAIALANAYTGTDEIEIVFDDSLVEQTLILESDIEVPSNVTLRLKEGVKLDLQGYIINVHGKFEVQNSSQIESIIGNGEIMVEQYGTLLFENAIAYVKNVVLNDESTSNITSTSGIENLIISNNCYTCIKGNDFSNTQIVLPEIHVDAIFDLSGNDWGTVRLYEIIAKITGYNQDSVIVDPILATPTHGSVDELIEWSSFLAARDHTYTSSGYLSDRSATARLYFTRTDKGRIVLKGNDTTTHQWIGIRTALIARASIESDCVYSDCFNTRFYVRGYLDFTNRNIYMGEGNCGHSHAARRIPMHERLTVDANASISMDGGSFYLEPEPSTYCEDSDLESWLFTYEAAVIRGELWLNNVDVTGQIALSGTSSMIVANDCEFHNSINLDSDVKAPSLYGTNNTAAQSCLFKIDTYTGSNVWDIRKQKFYTKCLADVPFIYFGSISSDIDLNRLKIGEKDINYQVRWVDKGAHLTINEGCKLVYLSRDSTDNVFFRGKLSACFSSANDAIYIEKDAWVKEVLVSGEARFEKANVYSESELAVLRISGTVDMTESALFVKGGIVVAEQGFLNLSSVACTGEIIAESGAMLRMRDTQISKLVLSTDALMLDLVGNDFSNAEIVVIDSDDGGIIDLSGNYWGTTDIDAIIAKIQNYSEDRVLISSILMAPPTQEFCFDATMAAKHRLSHLATSLTLSFNRLVDADTVNAASILLTDAEGNKVAIQKYEVSGKKVTLYFDELPTGDYQVNCTEELKDVDGKTFTHSVNFSSGITYHCLQIAQPRVLLFRSNSTVTDVFSYVDVFFDQVMDDSTISLDSVHLYAPDGQEIELTQMRKAGVSGNIFYRFYFDTVSSKGTYTLSVDQSVCNDWGVEMSADYQHEIYVASPDLTVGTELDVSSTTLGRYTTITYTVSNIGDAMTPGTWTDAVYLCRTQQWNEDEAILLGRHNRTEALENNGSYTASIKGLLSGLEPGDYYVFVRTDESDRLSEGRENNNVSATETKISIRVPEIAMEATQSKLSSANEMLYYAFTPTESGSYILTVDDSSATVVVTSSINGKVLNKKTSAKLTHYSVFSAKAGETYYIAIKGGKDTSYTTQIQKSEFAVYDSSFTNLASGHPSTLTLVGSEFAEGMAVYVVDENGVRYDAERVTIVDSNQATVTFSLPEELAAGTKLTLYVQNEADTVVKLEESLHIATFSDLVELEFTNMNGERHVGRVGWVWKADLYTENKAGYDVSNAIILITDTAEDFAMYYGYDDAKVRDRSALLFLGGADALTPEVMTAGESSKLGIYIKNYRSGVGAIQAWLLDPNSKEEITAAQWSYFESALRPTACSDADWSAWWSDMQPRIGNTIGDFATFIYGLRDAVAAAGQKVNVSSLADLTDIAMKHCSDYVPGYVFDGVMIMDVTKEKMSDQLVILYQKDLEKGWVEIQSCITAEDGSFRFSGLQQGFEYAVGSDVKWVNASEITQEDNLITFDVSDGDVSLLTVVDYNGILDSNRDFIYRKSGEGKLYRFWLRNGRLVYSIFDEDGWSAVHNLIDSEIEKYGVLWHAAAESFVIIQDSDEDTNLFFASVKENNELILSEHVSLAEYMDAQSLCSMSITDSDTLFFSCEENETGNLKFFCLDEEDIAELKVANDFVINETGAVTLDEGWTYKTGIKWQKKNIAGFFDFSISGTGEVVIDSDSGNFQSAKLTFSGKGEIKIDSQRHSVAGGVAVTLSGSIKETVKNWSISLSVPSFTVSYTNKYGLIPIFSACVGAVGAAVFAASSAGIGGVAGFKLAYESTKKALTWISDKTGFTMGVKVTWTGNNRIWAAGAAKTGWENKIKVEAVIKDKRGKHVDIGGGVTFTWDGSEFKDAKMSWHAKFSMDLTIKGYGFVFTVGHDDKTGGLSLEVIGKWGEKDTLRTGSLYVQSEDGNRISFTTEKNVVSFELCSEDGVTTMVYHTWLMEEPDSSPESEVVNVSMYTNVQSTSGSFYMEDLTVSEESCNDARLISFVIGSRVAPVSDFDNIDDFLKWEESIRTSNAYINSLLYNKGELIYLDSSNLEETTLGVIEKTEIISEEGMYMAWIRQNGSLYEVYAAELEENRRWKSPELLYSSEYELSSISLYHGENGLSYSFLLTQAVGEENLINEITFTDILVNNGENCIRDALTGEKIDDVLKDNAQVPVVELFTEMSEVLETSGIRNMWDEFVDYVNKKLTPVKWPGKDPDDELSHEDFSSYDPNDFYGPAAYGKENWIAPQEMQFQILCENIPEENIAHAAMVTIKHKLDDAYDYSTFRLGDMMIGGNYVEISEDVTSYKARLDWTSTLGVLVDVNAFFDADTGEVVWEFVAIDPETGWIVSDPFKGLLAPNYNPPEGDGWGYYYVEPKETTVTGTTATSQAEIIFDYNEPIMTPVLSYTFDVDRPEGAVTAVAATACTRYLRVDWSGTDEGSGVACYNVFVSVDGGDWELWQENISATSALFTVAEGEHRYAFFAQAIDNVGLAEALEEMMPAEAETTASGKVSSLSVENVQAERAGDELTLSIAFSEQAVCADWVAALLVSTSAQNIDLSTGTFRYDATTHVLTWVGTVAGVPDGAQATVRLTDGAVTDAAGLPFGSSAPAYTAPVELPGVVGSTYAAPSLIDYDGDGLLDIVVGEGAENGKGRIRIYLNEGSAEVASFASFIYASTAEDTPLELAATGCQGAIVRLADITGDGKDEMVVGLADGTIRIFTAAEDGYWADSGELSCSVGGESGIVDAGTRAAIEFVDANGDGHTDLLVGTGDGNVLLYLNTSAEGAAAFDAGRYLHDASGRIDVGSRATVATGDLDGDGLWDMLLGTADGTVLFYRNEGTTGTPLFGAAETVFAGDALLDMSSETNRVRIDTGDLNGDGIDDLVVGQSDGKVKLLYGTDGADLIGEVVVGSIPLPGVPQNVQMMVDGSALTISWDAVAADEAADISYELSYLVSGAEAPTVVAVSGTETTLELPDGVYSVQVRALNHGKGGDWSTAQNVTVDTVAPEVPGGVSAEGGETQAVLSWGEVADAASYELRYRKSGSEVWRTVSGTEASVSLESLDPAEYVWQVRAVDAAGNASEWSASSTFTVTGVLPDAEQHWANGLRFDASGAVTGGYYDVNKTGSGDSNLCWAAAVANMLAWWQEQGMTTTVVPDAPQGAETIYATFTQSWENSSGVDVYGLIWWLSGDSTSSGYDDYVDAHYRGDSTTGAYYEQFYTPQTIAQHTAQVQLAEVEADTLSSAWVDIYEASGMIALGVFRSVGSGGSLSGGHSLTLWGFETNLDTGRVQEIYVTDSDDNTTALETLAVEYDEQTGYYTVAQDGARLNGYVLGTYTYLKSFTGTDIVSPEVTVEAPVTEKLANGRIRVTFRWSCSEAAACVLTVDGQTYTVGSETSYTLELADGEHAYSITATDAAGNSGSATGSFAMDATAPAVVQGLQAITGESGVAVSWDAVEEAASYTLEYATKADFSEANSVTGITGTSYALTDVPGTGTLYVRVAAADAAGNVSDWSASAQTGLDITAPVVTLNEPDVNKIADGKIEVTFSWTCTEPAVYVLTVDGKEYSVRGATRYTLELADGEHVYSVKATDGVGLTGSAESSFVMDATAPTVVQGVQAITGESGVAVSWNVVEDAASYTLEYATKPDFSDAKSVTGITGASYALTALPGKGTLYVRVASADAAGNVSAWSAVAESALDITAPGAVQGLEVMAHGTSARLRWDAVSDASGITGYRIEYAVDGDFTKAQSLQVNSTEATFYTLLAGAAYQWRVAAVDGAGNVGEWSVGEAFRTGTAEPEDDSTAESREIIMTVPSGGESHSTTRVNGWVGFDDPSDFYCFTAKGEGAYAVSLDGAALGTQVYLSVGALDKAGNFVTTRKLLVAPGSAAAALGGIALEQGEKCYIRVESYDKGLGRYNGEYSLSVNAEVADTARVTDNNSTDKATMLKPADAEAAELRSWVGAGDAVDYYCFELANPVELTLGLSAPEAAVKVKLLREEPDGSVSQVMSRSVKANRGLDHTLSLTSGTYFVEVASYDNGAGRYNTTYALELEKEEENGETKRFTIANA